MSNTTIFLAVLAVALTAVVLGATQRALVGARARRRATWELDRAEWRRWITRRP